QPTFAREGGLALGHNGNLINTAELAARMRGPQRATTDTEILTQLLAERAHSDPEVSVESAAMDLLPQVHGAFSLVFMDENTLYAARDPQGIRPFVLGRLGETSGAGGWVVASETAALDIVGAEQIREIDPGELLTIDERGDRKSTRLNSSHVSISYAVFCLKKK